MGSSLSYLSDLGNPKGRSLSFPPCFFNLAREYYIRFGLDLYDLTNTLSVRLYVINLGI